MSLNSLTDQMSRRAASMAGMAKSTNNPQEIQAIQQRLIAEVQSGAVKPYIGVPLIQELTNKLVEAKAQAAQIMAGVGMQQPPQGGSPIAQQVMQQAAQESQGVTSLQSNLPQEYAGGGIIAFEDGGQVERYQNTGLVSGTPAGRFFSGLGQNFTEANEMAKLRNKLQMQYGPASAIPGLFMNQTDEERLAAKLLRLRYQTYLFRSYNNLRQKGHLRLLGLVSLLLPLPLLLHQARPPVAPAFKHNLLPLLPLLLILVLVAVVLKRLLCKHTRQPLRLCPNAQWET